MKSLRPIKLSTASKCHNILLGEDATKLTANSIAMAAVELPVLSWIAYAAGGSPMLQLDRHVRLAMRE